MFTFRDAGLSAQNAIFGTPEAVPFRFTPNLQHLLGPILTEGILASGLMAIGRCLTEPEVWMVSAVYLVPCSCGHTVVRA